jgi:hypothetical protein
VEGTNLRPSFQRHSLTPSHQDAPLYNKHVHISTNVIDRRRNSCEIKWTESKDAEKDPQTQKISTATQAAKADAAGAHHR